MSASKLVRDIDKLVLGKAKVFAGSFAAANGLSELAITEGATTVTPASTFSTLTLPEESGDAPLDVIHLGDTLTATLPLIVGDPDLWAKISPRGRASGGTSKQQRVVVTSLVIIPVSELGVDGTFGYANGIWTPAVPSNAIFIHKGYFQHAPREYEHNANGNKKVTSVTFTAIQDDAQPDGYQLWFQGSEADDYVAAGGTLAI